MNEMDLKTKIEGLKKAIAEHNDFSKNYADDLAKVEKQLADYNKPELEPVVFDQITEAIEEAIDGFSFDDADNYTFEYELDYDGRVATSSVEFDTYDIKERICNAVYKLFKEADCPTDEENARDDREAEQVADQLNTQTVAEKVI